MLTSPVGKHTATWNWLSNFRISSFPSPHGRPLDMDQMDRLLEEQSESFKPRGVRLGASEVDCQSDALAAVLQLGATLLSLLGDSNHRRLRLGLPDCCFGALLMTERSAARLAVERATEGELTASVFLESLGVDSAPFRYFSKCSYFLCTRAVSPL
jgi:hypothetical protein